jgi:predicted RNA-binding protein with PUA domain
MAKFVCALCRKKFGGILSIAPIWRCENNACASVLCSSCTIGVISPKCPLCGSDVKAIYR